MVVLECIVNSVRTSISNKPERSYLECYYFFSKKTIGKVFCLPLFHKREKASAWWMGWLSTIKQNFFVFPSFANMLEGLHCVIRLTRLFFDISFNKGGVLSELITCRLCFYILVLISKKNMWHNSILINDCNHPSFMHLYSSGYTLFPEIIGALFEKRLDQKVK